MSDIVIRVENVSKRYRLGLIGGGTLHDDFERWWAKVRGRPDPLLKIGQEDQSNRQGEYIWALRDVSFQVQQGEVLGIIGRNGAGKSTLLKILSRVTAPTSGQVKIKGRVASLLEVGTGFHPELTGRENIYLNGAILGMKKAEIDRKFDEIVAFAEIEKFMDTPVKRYSSGMYVRLAFAVAAHLEPEILLVDEVLAVGDAEFQKKCLGKMKDVAGRGRTVLFVSHNMASVEALCSQAVLLNHGSIQQLGETTEVIQRYLASKASLAVVPCYERQDREGDGSILITSLDIYGSGKNEQNGIATGSELNLRINYKVNRRVRNPVFKIGIYDGFGVQLVYLSTAMVGYTVRLTAERGSLECKIPRLPLSPGRYSVNVAVTSKDGIADWIESAALCDVKEGRFYDNSEISWRRDGWRGLLIDHVWGP